MASIQNLKKELDYVSSELLHGCFVAGILNPQADAAKSLDIEKKIYELREGTLARINGYRLARRGETKGAAYFKGIRADLMEGAKKIVAEIEAIQ